MNVKTMLIILIFPHLVFSYQEARDKKMNPISRAPSCQKIINEITADIIVNENTVVFLVITQLEKDLLDNKTKEDISDALDDVYYYADKAIVKIENKKIRCMCTTNKNLVFKYPDGREDRLSFNTMKGSCALALFGKGKKPIILYDNIVLDEDIFKAVSDYFEIDLK